MDRKSRDLELYNKHLDRIKNIKSKIDNTQPKKHPFTKKFQIEKTIEKKRLENENKIICNRILKSREKSRIDNKLSDVTQRFKMFKQQIFYHKHKITIDKLNRENHKLLERLVNVEPVYKFI
jgi:hypothetical protein